VEQKTLEWVSAADLRQRFLKFFEAREHTIVDSSPLVPGNDPTLLFTNSGMVQFKDVFLGTEQRSYRRATTSQRCVRAGGKHNDLENVGYTARHHTFFEMLGNFSFGDYFKEDAIKFAWEFLTGVLKLPAEKLWVTVHASDDEAADIWLNAIGVNPAQFTRIDSSDNFWQMGDTGPCGPCTEIFYDHGPEVPGGPPGTPEEDGDRYIEIWNLVFMQYERDADGTLNPLPKQSVDTGMGLERLAAVMQGVHSNYEIDLFQNLMRAIAALAGVQDLDNSSLRVIADHIRSCAFLVADGVTPSNDGRGYVLRRIIRRAARHGYMLGLHEAFFNKLVQPLAEEMGEAFPILVKSQAHIETTLRREEERFLETLEQGMRILDENLRDLKGTEIPGSLVFKLYDTFGFPVDLTGDIARERQLTLDMQGFELEMEAQRERARAASQFGVDHSTRLEGEPATEFTGYSHLDQDVKVLAVYRGGERVDALQADDSGIVVLNRTPFYAESGGQVGDRGVIRGDDFHFDVHDTQKQGGVFVHSGTLTSGQLTPDGNARASVDAARRQATVLNHSATHLLHAALREVLGDHVQQKGSLVDHAHLRFDFSHPQPLSDAEVAELERIVNRQIRGNATAEAREMSMDDAMSAGALAFFGDKYGDRVRVLSIGDYSTELCGGTHVGHAGDIGIFKITTETGIASGVRRIEALTGENAWQWIAAREARLQAIAGMLKAAGDEVDSKVAQLLERNRALEKELQRIRDKVAAQTGSDVASQAVDVNGVQVLAVQLEGVDAKALRDMADQLKNKLGTAAIVLAAVEDEKVRLVAGVTKDRTEVLKAGELVNSVAQKIGGRGGGRADMAQAGGTDAAGLAAALAAVPDWVRARLD
jgi:alanyl-tRNA synthetase